MSNDSSIKRQHGALLEDLRDLLDSTVLRPLHKTVISKANNLLLDQALQIEALHAQLAGFRKVGCVPISDLATFEVGHTDLLTVYPAPQQFMTEWKTIYVKDGS